MSPASAYIIGKFSAEIDKNGLTFQKAHKKLVDKYVKKNKNGSPKMIGDDRYDIPKKKIGAFNKEFQELNGIEEEYDLMEKVSLGNDEKLTPRDALLLGEIFDLGNK